MEPRGLLTYSQAPATCPYPELDQSSPGHYISLLQDPLLYPSNPGSSKRSSSLRSPHQNPVYTSPLYHTCYNPRSSHYSPFDHTSSTYKSLTSSLRSLHPSPVTSTPLGPNILLSTLFSYTLSLCSSLNVSDQVSHPYKTTCNIIVRMCILISILFDSKQQDITTFCPE